MKKYLPFLTLIFFICLIAISTYKLNKTQEIAQETPIIKDQGDDSINFVKTKITLPDFELTDLFDENKKFSKKDLLGQYSVINFFASWCSTCRAEHNILLRLKNEKNINLYGIAWRDIDQNTKKFFDNYGNPFKQTLKDPQSLFGNIIDISAVPETIIINPDGVVIARYRGNLQEFAVGEILNLVGH